MVVNDLADGAIFLYLAGMSGDLLASSLNPAETKSGERRLGHSRLENRPQIGQ